MLYLKGVLLWTDGELMQLYRLEYESNEANLGICLPIRMSLFLWQGSYQYTKVVYGVLWYTEVKLGQWRKNELVLQWTDIRTIWWMYGVKVIEKFTHAELRETRNRWHWYSGAAK